jgi:hypothetical protein
MREFISRTIKAMQAVNTPGPVTEEQQQVLDEARRFLQKCEIACLEADRVVFPELVHACRELVAEVGEDNPDLVVRELADICRSLRRHKEGELRSKNGKFLNAQLFFTALRDEIPGNAKPWF